jgi:hypothetical protein
MRDREKEILDRETSIQKKEFEMESERRKFETEKEITLARLEDEREKIKVKSNYSRPVSIPGFDYSPTYIKAVNNELSILKS